MTLFIGSHTPVHINNSTPTQPAKVETVQQVTEPTVAEIPNETTAVVETPATVVVQETPPEPTGDKQTWMNQAGINPSDYGYVDYIAQRESSWNPSAVNSIGACGLFQQLPCGKWSHQWNDPVGAIIDANTYALQRYGSWANAYNFWLRNNWW